LGIFGCIWVKSHAGINVAIELSMEVAVAGSDAQWFLSSNIDTAIEQFVYYHVKYNWEIKTFVIRALLCKLTEHLQHKEINHKLFNICVNITTKGQTKIYKTHT
jgi:hypothetical protein